MSSLTPGAGLGADPDPLIKYDRIETGDIDTIYLVGAISACCLTCRIMSRRSGAAQAGAAEMLLSQTLGRESEECAADIEHIKPNELESDFDFLVADNMYFSGAVTG
jgi:hypothetical protein